MIKRGLIIFGKLKLGKKKRHVEERNALRYKDDKKLWEIVTAWLRGISRGCKGMIPCLALATLSPTVALETGLTIPPNSCI
jgi:hypothetical protein